MGSSQEVCDQDVMSTPARYRRGTFVTSSLVRASVTHFSIICGTEKRDHYPLLCITHTTVRGCLLCPSAHLLRMLDIVSS